MLKELKISLFVLLVFSLLCGHAFGGHFSATKRTDSAYNKIGPQLQLVGSKIYYVWYEGDGSNEQIWTAKMNTDGTEWSATKRTDSAYNKWWPQFQVVENKIYYVWTETVDDSYDSDSQIWTAEMNTDGTGWSATERTDSAYSKMCPQLQVVDNKIYYIWTEEDDSSNYQIWTAEMNTNGTGWAATKRTTSAYDKWGSQLQVVVSKIYYLWAEDDPNQIWTGEMNTDGTGWAATKRTDSAVDKCAPQFQVVENKIHYVWCEWVSPNSEVWTAQMNTNGTGWSATKRKDGGSDQLPQLQAVGSKIYYVWEGGDGSNEQIWTANMNTDGTGWSETKRTDSPYYNMCPQLQVVDKRIHYVWDEDDGANNQIWTAVEILPSPEGMILLLLGE
jgi:hypothetical protein